MTMLTTKINKICAKIIFYASLLFAISIFIFAMTLWIVEIR